MYFKQLELTGFKSFADRTILRMEPGVTAIVGPNGCGKSNILDSMRWVLGEQRPKELRGSSMQDIVFNGSENRHALGMAEVSVTFDNADSSLPVDFSEVQITRRIYRSGESEYLINKVACRLKDIQELIMGTGMGTSAYSMIGQGKMDLILSSKPEDRRFVFEEAAGIIKYKNRKRQAMRRLESAEQNLLRLGDIVAEVQRQMRSLKRQVNAAIRYRELSDQLRDLEIRARWLEFVRLSAEIGDLRKVFAESSKQFEQVSTRISALEARQEEVGLSRLETERIRLARQQGVHEIDSEMERLEREIALLRQQIEHAEEKRENATREQQILFHRVQTLNENISATEGQAETVRGQIAEAAAAMEQRSAEHTSASERVTQAEADVEGVRARLAERMTDRARTQTEIESLAESIAALDGQLQNVYSNQTQLSARRDEALAGLERARSEEAAKQDALAQADEKRVAAAEERTRLAQASQQLDEAWRVLREEKSSTEARLNSLRELRDNYEGFAFGVRAVMKAFEQQQLHNIIGPVGDLLSTDKQFERAIEAALGGNINNIVVEHADAAKSAIAFLKEHSAGRVTFLPLDTIRGGLRDDMSAMQGEAGVVGPAIDFVRFDDRLRSAVEYLLHSTVIVETLDDAIRITRSRQSHPRLVTLDGDMVSSSGAVTGGRTKHESRGLLGRSAEISELEERVVAMDGQIGTMAEERKRQLEAIAANSRELSGLENEIAAARLELGEIGVAVARHNAEIENLTQRSHGLDQQRDELSARRSQLEQQRREALDRADTIQSDDDALQQELASVQEAAADARQALSICASELADLRIRQVELKQRLDEIERDRQRQVRDRDEANAEAERKGELSSQLSDERKTVEETIALHIERSRALSESKEEASRKAVEAQNQLQTLLDENESLEKELKELRETSRAAQSEVHRTELQLRQNEDRVGFFQERIASEYGVALGSLTEEAVGTDEHDDETRDEMVNDLRNRLQKMGDVNLMAIEEYEELEKREAFLVSQSQDLQLAREALMGVIEKCDVRIREMFMDTFSRISVCFSDFFRRLFNGGQARIYLLEEDDPLESGIEIEARPPGKKPTSISLLSGGESAMTAVALLFSIFKAKPSPFCVLDEVDAPLDDANIGRFLNLLDEFAAESQFIVITHNKQTMARADALYGVTMQERGVSQLVGVRMNGK